MQRHGLRSGDHAFGDDVATHDAAEDVHQDGFQARVFQHDLEGFGDLLGGCAAADVQEVGRLAAEQLDGVHGGHGQAGAVHQAADVAVQRDVSQVEFRCFDFGRIFFVQVAVGDDFRVTEQGVRVEVELGVQRDDLARTRQDQRVDFGQRRIGFPVGFVQALQVGARVGDRFFRHADLAGDVVGLLIGQADRRFDRDAVDFFRVAVRDFFDVHAAFRRGHQHDFLGDAVGDHRHVQFFLDVRAFFDQQAAHFLAFRAGLVGHQLHAHDLVRVFAYLFDRLGDFHATALAAAASMDLRLDDPDRAAQLFSCFHGLIHRHARNAARNGHSELSEDLFALILMDLHAGFPSSVTD